MPNHQPSPKETLMFRPARLAIAAATTAAAAALLLPLAAAAAPDNRAAAPAAAAATPASGAHYCARDHAYQLHDCRLPPHLPPGPLGAQLHWLLHQLAGGADQLTVDELQAHLTPGLQQVQSAAELLAALRHTLAERGPMRLLGYSYPPRPDQALALVRSGPGPPAAGRI